MWASAARGPSWCSSAPPPRWPAMATSGGCSAPSADAAGCTPSCQAKTMLLSPPPPTTAAAAAVASAVGPPSRLPLPLPVWRCYLRRHDAARRAGAPSLWRVRRHCGGLAGVCWLRRDWWQTGRRGEVGGPGGGGGGPGSVQDANSHKKKEETTTDVPRCARRVPVHTQESVSEQARTHHIDREAFHRSRTPQVVPPRSSLPHRQSP